MTHSATTWRFPAIFWTANSVELLERAAFYGMYISLALYLSRVVGFTDIEAGWIGAGYSALIYFFPMIVGAISDRIGFRAALMLAFALLGLGYAGLGFFPTKLLVIVSLFLVSVGGAFIKPLITGTVAKSSDTVNRARAYSLFYMVVNIGSFTGKTIAKPVRVSLGLEYIPLYSAGACFLALLVVAFFYWPKKADHDERPRSIGETLRGMWEALTNFRFLSLILITAGFWMIQGQLYASMPKYVLRMVGEAASPEWYANVNPLVVVSLVVPITHLVRKLRPVTSIGIAMAIIPFSALTMSLSSLLSGNVNVAGWSVHPITVMMVIGIASQGLAECFLSPRYYEFASRQAPKGQEGLYLGYAHLNTFFAWFIGFVLSGYLLDAFCPEPTTLSPDVQALYQTALAGKGTMPAAYAHAHYIWYAFFGVGMLAFIALLVFRTVTDRMDRKKESVGEAATP
ncbi:MAG TPA: MFS transporter [Thermoanaerobaculia bacterium]|nr:MFS transporter [Thermoanaerobaculia bacterium]HUM29819.1 MFS transporter [Thermoanaerobaculia bacterium]HXK68094.1 MFS transporter [Thermoanaerobaculia bacterium]